MSADQEGLRTLLRGLVVDHAFPVIQEVLLQYFPDAPPLRTEEGKEEGDRVLWTTGLGFVDDKKEERRLFAEVALCKTPPRIVVRFEVDGYPDSEEDLPVYSDPGKFDRQRFKEAMKKRAKNIVMFWKDRAPRLANSEPAPLAWAAKTAD